MSVQLSLICPVYKVAKYIPTLMQSLLAGVNTEQIEIIFVDDCCPENSIVICEKFIAEHKQDIKFTSQIIKQKKNQGQAVARNEGLKIAQGEYIGFIDSDDALAVNYWETLKPFAESSKYDIIEFGFEEFTTTLPIVNETSITERASSKLNPFFTGFFVWTRLYKKETVASLVFPNGIIYEDIFYNIHAFARARTTIRLSSCLVYYRKRTESTTSTRTSSYSNLLLNMVTAVQSTIDSFQRKDTVVGQVARYSLLVSLKGFTINERQDRRLFFRECKKINSSFSPIFQKFNQKLMSTFKFKFSKFICVIGRFS